MAIADAAFLRSRSAEPFIVRQVSTERPFIVAEWARSKTAQFLHANQVCQTRANLPFDFFYFGSAIFGLRPLQK